MPDADPSPAAVDPRRSTVRWGLGDALGGWVVAQVGAMIASSLALAASGDEFDDLSLSWIAVAQLGLWFGLLGAPLLAGRLKGRGLVRDFGLRLRWPDAWVGPFWGVFTQVVLVTLLYVPIRLLFDIDTEQLQEPARGLTDRATDPLGVALLVLVVGIGAPIVEEIFYRGLLQRALERRFGTWPGVVGTAMLFGVAHFQPLQLPALVLFGLVLGVMTHRTGRLGPAITAHMVFNMVTVISLVSS